MVVKQSANDARFNLWKWDEVILQQSLRTPVTYNKVPIVSDLEAANHQLVVLNNSLDPE